MVVHVDDVVGTWPNAEDVVKELCRGVRVDGHEVTRVGRETAVGDTFEPPCIRIERVGGGIDRNFTSDNPIVEVACFGSDYGQAQQMSGSVARLMEASIGEQVGPAVIDAVRQDEGPIRPNWGAANARRDITRWRLSWRPTFS